MEWIRKKSNTFVAFTIKKIIFLGEGCGERKKQGGEQQIEQK